MRLRPVNGSVLDFAAAVEEVGDELPLTFEGSSVPVGEVPFSSLDGEVPVLGSGVVVVGVGAGVVAGVGVVAGAVGVVGVCS